MKNVFVIALIVFVLTACSPQSATTPIPTNPPPPADTQVPPATETTAPLPTETAVPTATLEPSPTPDPLIFRDDFEGSIDKSWQWIRENPKYWNLTNNPGWLEIMARSGVVKDGNMQNLILQPVPGGNFVLETKLKFEPIGKYQLAGLLIYESAEKYIQFGRAYCGSPQCSGDGLYFDLINHGNFTPENFASATPKTDTIYLRITRDGVTYTAYSSENGVDWKLAGAHNVGLAPLFVGLLAGQANNSVPKPAQFDYFQISALP